MCRTIAVALVMCATACGAAVDEQQVDAVLEMEGDAQAGEAFYEVNCERCHGPGGNGQGQGPSLQGNALDRETIVETILRGPFSMPSYADEPNQDIADVTAYVETL